MALNLKLIENHLTDRGYLVEMKDIEIVEEGLDLINLDAINAVFRDLNGILAKPPLTFLDNIMVVNNRYVLLYDDHVHFNRYRAVTLKSYFYEDVKGFDREQYRRYCKIHEKECLKSGLKEGTWSSKKSEAFFGKPSSPGDFFGNGSPGWKLNAYKDCLLDLYATHLKFYVIRVSCYDNMLINNQLIKIGKLCEGSGNMDLLSKHFHSKISVLLDR
jgi:hypothetical protein